MAAATRPTAAAPSAFGGGGGGGGRGGRSGGSVGEPGRGAPNLALAGQGRGAAPGAHPDSRVSRLVQAAEVVVAAVAAEALRRK